MALTDFLNGSFMLPNSARGRAARPLREVRFQQVQDRNGASKGTSRMLLEGQGTLMKSGRTR